MMHFIVIYSGLVNQDPTQSNNALHYEIAAKTLALKYAVSYHVLLAIVGVLGGLAVLYMGSAILRDAFNIASKRSSRVLLSDRHRWFRRQRCAAYSYMLLGTTITLCSLFCADPPLNSLWDVVEGSNPQPSDRISKPRSEEKNGNANAADPGNKATVATYSLATSQEQASQQQSKSSLTLLPSLRLGFEQDDLASERLVVQEIAAVVSALAFALALVGIRWEVVRWKTDQRRRFDDERVRRTESLSQKWNKDILQQQKTIERNVSPGRIGSEIARIIAHAVPGEVEEQGRLYEAQAAVISLMNTFETIAILYHEDQIDTELVDQAMARAVLIRYLNVRSVATAIEEKAGTYRWALVHEIAREWIEDRPWLYQEYNIASDTDEPSRIDKEFKESRKQHQKYMRKAIMKSAVEHGRSGSQASPEECMALLKARLIWSAPHVFKKLPTAEPRSVLNESCDECNGVYNWYERFGHEKKANLFIIPRGRLLTREEAKEDYDKLCKDILKGSNNEVTQDNDLSEVKDPRFDWRKILDNPAGGGYFVDVSNRGVYEWVDGDPRAIYFGTIEEFMGFLKDVHSPRITSVVTKDKLVFDVLTYRQMEAGYLSSLGSRDAEEE